MSLVLRATIEGIEAGGGDLAMVGVQLDANARASQLFGGHKGRSAARKRVKDYTAGRRRREGQEVLHQIQRFDSWVVVAWPSLFLRCLAAIEESRGPAGVAVGAVGRRRIWEVAVIAAFALAPVALLTGLHFAAGKCAALGVQRPYRAIGMALVDGHDLISVDPSVRFTIAGVRPHVAEPAGPVPRQLPRGSPRRTVVSICRHSG